MSQWLFPIVLALHAVAAVFWAGVTFVLARNPGAGGDRLTRAQLGAAAFAIVAGLLLFWMGHSAGTTKTVIIVGAVSALGAAVAQGWMRRRNPGLSNRIASPLLVVALIAMVTARYWG